MTEVDLLYGAWLALEQTGRLLQSATILFDRGDRPSAFVLAMFGREELGRSQILRRLAERVHNGDPVAVNDVRDACDDHVIKQRDSQLSATLVADRGTTVGNAMHAMLTLPIDSREYREARGIVESATRARERRAAGGRHDRRMRALYVDLDPAGTWSRPQDLDDRLLGRELVDVINDYAGEHDRLRDEVIEDDHPAMAAARRAMRPNLVLPLPTWPQELSSM